MHSPKSGQFFGTYAGTVVSASDPYQIGRVQVRVPILHGIAANEQEIIANSDLPWALPAGLPAGGSSQSGGISWLPVSGDQVWIRFLDGELEKPIWEWGNQNSLQVKKYGPLNAYSGSQPTSRAALTRYSHWWELLPTGHDIWTKNGYHFTITDGNGNGSFQWKTQAGYFTLLSDASKSFQVSVTSSYFYSNLFWVGGTGGGDAIFSVDVPNGKVSLGGGASDPLVRLSDLVSAFNQLKQIYDVHTHGNSGPPSPSLTANLSGSKLIQSENNSSVSQSI